MQFPIYILRLNEQWKIVFPEDRGDVGHSTFWENVVSHIVADHHRIPQGCLANLPYCQRRARVVGDKVYFGGTPDPDLLQSIQKAVGNDDLSFVYDDHEKRLAEDVRAFRRLVRRYSSDSQKG